MFNLFIPGRVYEVLPVVYVTSGVSTAMMIDQMLAIVSGLLLISAGCLVWRMRHVYRRQSRQQAAYQRAMRRRNDARDLEKSLRQIQGRLR